MRREKRFAEVAGDDFFWGPNGREIGAGVPAEKDFEVGGKLKEQGFGQGSSCYRTFRIRN